MTVLEKLNREADERADICRALLRGCERRYFAAAFSPTWFSDRDEAVADVCRALEKLQQVLQRVGAPQETLDGVHVALHAALKEVPLVTLTVQGAERKRSGRPRNVGRDIANRHLRRVPYLSERERRELLDAAGLTIRLDRHETR
jgi:hypothetical protein